jgi:hypothetical protein
LVCNAREAATLSLNAWTEFDNILTKPLVYMKFRRDYPLLLA